MRWLGFILAGLLATAAEAVPVTFSAHDGRAAIRVFGGDWFAAEPGTPAVEGGATGARQLVVLFYVGPFGPGAAPVAFHATVTFANGQVEHTDYTLPILPPVAAPTTWGVFVGFTVPDGISDYEARALYMAVTLPEDERHLAFAVQQPVPEPSTLALTGTVMVGLGWWLRRRRARESRAVDTTHGRL